MWWPPHPLEAGPHDHRFFTHCCDNPRSIGGFLDRILYCITAEHDWRWTLAAGLVCVLGFGTALRLLNQARDLGERRSRVLLAAFVGGTAAFSTHFLAIQGYQVDGEIRYGLWLTLASCLAVLGCFGLA